LTDTDDGAVESGIRFSGYTLTVHAKFLRR